MQDIVNLISNVGFPIVITLVMFYFIENITEKYLSSLNSNLSSLEKSINDLTIIVNRMEENLTDGTDQKEAKQVVPDNKQTK